jgi:chromosome segregation ATPase
MFLLVDETSHLKNMKPNVRRILLVTAALLAAGCEKKASNAERIDSAQTKVTEVADEMEGHTIAMKDQFIREMRSQLAAINRDLDELAGKVEASSESAKAEAAPKIKSLREQTALLRSKLDGAVNVTESNWEEFKSDVLKTRAASVDEINKARQWLGDKISP